MGQKIHPIGFRLGITTEWNSHWYVDGKKQYRDNLCEDLEVRRYLKEKLVQASVSRIQINRERQDSYTVTIHTARPGIVIGKKGEDVEAMRYKIATMVNLHDNNVRVYIEEIRKPEIDAYLVASSVAQQLERRIMFRRAMKRAVQNAMRLGAVGIKINVAGRLNGAEIARSEWYREGRVPLHTLRANIDYGVVEAHTTYGIIGVKVWICKGETEPGKSRREPQDIDRGNRRAQNPRHPSPSTAQISQDKPDASNAPSVSGASGAQSDQDSQNKQSGSTEPDTGAAAK